MTDIVVPAEQEGTKAVVKTWLKKPGDAINRDDPVVEIETDKVAVEIAAEAAGTLSEILVQEGAEVEPGTVLGRIVPGGAVESSVKAMAQGAGLATPVSQASHPARAADRLPPGIRKLLADNGLEAGDVPISGTHLTREDILAEIGRRAETPAIGVTRVPHDSMRRRIAANLSRSMQVAPHVTAMFEADFSAIAAHREAHRNDFAGQGANLTFTAYFIAASAAAMKFAPAVNGRWYEDRIDLYEDINIGIGTALGKKGLIVPVIHRVQSLGLLEISRRLTELTEKARTGRLSQDDVRGGTFSISNHGVSGSLLAAPIIINQPQSAILGVGKLQKRAVVRGDGIEIRPMAYVTLTIDHRVIDAFQTNAWLSAFVETLESWPSGI
jgi:2-oxoglutarate dehydrogenase E2 component (dihydrolipoamide succinyltransferase)